MFVFRGSLILALAIGIHALYRVLSVLLTIIKKLGGGGGGVSVLSWFPATITRETINTGPGTEDQGPKDPRTQSLEGCVALKIQLYSLSVPVLHA